MDKTSFLLRQKTFAKAQLSALVGVTCDYATMVFLTKFAGVHYAFSTAVGCVVGAAVNFSINRAWAFYSAGQAYRYSPNQQQLRYMLVVAGSIFLKVSGVYVLGRCTNFAYGAIRVATDIFVALSFSYTMQRWWVFRRSQR